MTGALVKVLSPKDSPGRGERERDAPSLVSYGDTTRRMQRGASQIQYSNIPHSPSLSYFRFFISFQQLNRLVGSKAASQSDRRTDRQTEICWLCIEVEIKKRLERPSEGGGRRKEEQKLAPAAADLCKRRPIWVGRTLI